VPDQDRRPRQPGDHFGDGVMPTSSGGPPAREGGGKQVESSGAVFADQVDHRPARVPPSHQTPPSTGLRVPARG
jgi:hypothetical protein